MLKPQDIVILLKIAAMGATNWRYDALANELCMSASEVHAGFKRAEHAQLADTQSKQPIMPALEEFLTHGIRYVFPAEVGELTRGMPTSYAAKPLIDFLMKTQEPPPVWPFVEGTTRGFSFLLRNFSKKGGTRPPSPREVNSRGSSPAVGRFAPSGLPSLFPETGYDFLPLPLGGALRPPVCLHSSPDLLR